MAFNQTIVVDVVHPKNKNPWFRPLRRALIAEFCAANLEGNVPWEIMACGGTIPGERLTVDFKNLSWKIVNRLALKENKEMAEKIRKMRATDERMPENVTFGDEAGETGRFPGDPDSIATWLFNLRVLLDQKELRVISGTIPERDEILKMGRVQVSAPQSGMPERLVERACFIPRTEDKQLVAAK
jgi:hypothetical protein